MYAAHVSAAHAVVNNIAQNNSYYYELYGDFLSHLGNSRPVFQYKNLKIRDAQSSDFGMD